MKEVNRDQFMYNGIRVKKSEPWDDCMRIDIAQKICDQAFISLRGMRITEAMALLESARMVLAMPKDYLAYNYEIILLDAGVRNVVETFWEVLSEWDNAIKENANEPQSLPVDDRVKG